LARRQPLIPRCLPYGYFDNNAIRAELDERSALAVIPSQARRKPQIPHDTEMYKWRHLIENYFQQLKEFRHIATRYAKTDTSFAANSIARRHAAMTF
jgi:transposase